PPEPVACHQSPVESLEERHRGTLTSSDSLRGFRPSPFPRVAALELIICLPLAGVQARKLMGKRRAHTPAGK
ncbi:hypothetical protein STEG23_023263, partial [Scotinomys teguina]